MAIAQLSVSCLSKSIMVQKSNHPTLTARMRMLSKPQCPNPQVFPYWLYGACLHWRLFVLRHHQHITRRLLIMPELGLLLVWLDFLTPPLAIAHNQVVTMLMAPTFSTQCYIHNSYSQITFNREISRPGPTSATLGLHRLQTMIAIVPVDAAATWETLNCQAWVQNAVCYFSQNHIGSTAFGRVTLLGPSD